MYIYLFYFLCSVTRGLISLPLHYVSWLANWIVANIVWFVVEFNFQWIGSLAFSFPTDEVSDDYSTETEDVEEVEPTMMMPSGESNIKDVFGKVMINRTRPSPCTKKVGLYQLTPERERIARPATSHCDPPFVVQSIPSSDMIMVVVHATCPDASDPLAYPMNVVPTEVDYNGTNLNCQKIKFKHNMPRRRPPSCIKEHEKEEDIKLCGNSNVLARNHLVELLCLLTFNLLNYIYKLS